MDEAKAHLAIAQEWCKAAERPSMSRNDTNAAVGLSIARSSIAIALYLERISQRLAALDPDRGR